MRIKGTYARFYNKHIYIIENISRKFNYNYICILYLRMSL